MNRHSVKLETRAPILSDVAVRLISEENLALAFSQGGCGPGVVGGGHFSVSSTISQRELVKSRYSLIGRSYRVKCVSSPQ